MRERVIIVPCLLILSIQTGCAGCRTIETKAAEIILPPEQEERLGRRLEAQIAQEMRELPLPQVQEYVERVGLRVAKPSEDERELCVEFLVLDKPCEINAFAIPGGNIYVFSGLILAADNEAELAGVLAHEVGHVTERHIAKRLVTAYGIQILAGLALGQNPGLLAQLATSIAAQGFLMRYSRDDEREADRVAVGYMVESDYSPQGLGTFFEEMQEKQGREPSAVELFFMTHPPPGERAERIEQRIAHTAPPGFSGQRDSPQFHRIQERLRDYYLANPPNCPEGLPE